MRQHLASIRQSVRHRAILGAAVVLTLLGSKAAFADVPPLSYVQGNPNSIGSSAVAKLLADAQVALNGGNIRLALIDLKNAVSSAPRNSAARAQLGIVLLRAGDAPSAERELRQARRDGASDTLVLPVLLETMLTRSESQMLLDQFPDPTSNAAAPVAADVLKARAMALQSLGRTAEAIDAMDRSLKLRRDAPGLLTRARLSTQQGNLVGAKSFIEEAIQKVIDWLTNKQIILTGEQNEIGRYEYQDFRTDEEKKLLLWTPVTGGLKLNAKTEWTEKNSKP